MPILMLNFHSNFDYIRWYSANTCALFERCDRFLIDTINPETVHGIYYAIRLVLQSNCYHARLSLEQCCYLSLYFQWNNKRIECNVAFMLMEFQIGGFCCFKLTALFITSTSTEPFIHVYTIDNAIWESSIII